MLKLLFVSSLLLTSVASFASPMDQIVTTKERIRLSLWIDGLDQKVEVTTKKETKARLPVELESALRKF